jgi:hypothetical protein
MNESFASGRSSGEKLERVRAAALKCLREGIGLCKTAFRCVPPEFSEKAKADGVTIAKILLQPPELKERE